MSITSSLREKALRAIREKIQYGVLKPEEVFTEALICEELDMSRTPVREALIQLVADGVLKKVLHKGYAVIEFDTKSKINFYTIYANLDAFAAISSLENITQEDIMKMNEIIDKIDIALKYKNYEEYYHLQDLFHKVYIDKCDNPLLIKMLGDFSHGHINRSYMGDNKEKLFAVLTEANCEHREIVGLFERKDREKIEDYLRYTHWITKYVDLI